MSSKSRLDMVLDSTLYESKVLQLRFGRTEEVIDQQCEQDARALGLDLAETQGLYCDYTHLQRFNVSPDQSLSPSRSRTFQLRRSESTDKPPILHSPKLEKLPGSPKAESQRPISPLKTPEPTRKAGSCSSSPYATNRLAQSQEDYFQQHSESSNKRSVSRRFSVFRQALVRLPIFKRSRSEPEQDKYSGCELCPLYEPLYLPVFRLPCQHAYCTHHIRQIISSAPQAQRNSTLAVPQCCGQPIPERFVRALTDNVEDEGLTRSMQSLLANDVAFCSRPSNDQGSLMCNLDRAMGFPDFQLLRIQQEAERDRFLDFHRAQKDTLSGLHDAAYDELVEHQTKEANDMKTNLCQELTDLEEKQLAAEMEQHELHKDERLKVDIALKHMERYFQSNGTSPPTSSSSSPNPEHTTLQNHHKPSQRDYLELMRQRWLRDNLEHRQESAINVTRGRQARALRLRREKQRSKLAGLGKQHEDAQGELDKLLEEEDEEFEKVFMERRLRIVKRWSVAVAVWANQWSESGVNTPGQMAGVEWPSL